MEAVIGVNVSQVDTTAKFAVGTVHRAPGGKQYKYVQYESGVGAVAAVSGNVCYYHGVAGDDSKVTSDLSHSSSVGAGVLQSAPADGSYCWIQTKGKATITTALTAGADGNALTPVGATDGTLDVSALVSDAICAYALDASAKIIMCDFPD